MREIAPKYIFEPCQTVLLILIILKAKGAEVILRIVEPPVLTGWKKNSHRRTCTQVPSPKDKSHSILHKLHFKAQVKDTDSCFTDISERRGKLLVRCMSITGLRIADVTETGIALEESILYKGYVYKIIIDQLRRFVTKPSVFVFVSSLTWSHEGDARIAGIRVGPSEKADQL